MHCSLHLNFCVLQFFFVPQFEIKPYLNIDSISHLLDSQLQLKHLFSLQLLLNNVTSPELRLRWEAMLKKQLQQNDFAVPMLTSLRYPLSFLTRSGVTVKNSDFAAYAQLLVESRWFRSLPHALPYVSAEARVQLLGKLEVDLREHLELHRIVPQVCALLTSFQRCCQASPVSSKSLMTSRCGYIYYGYLVAGTTK